MPKIHKPLGEGPNSDVRRRVQDNTFKGSQESGSIRIPKLGVEDSVCHPHATKAGGSPEGEHQPRLVLGIELLNEMNEGARNPQIGHGMRLEEFENLVDAPVYIRRIKATNQIIDGGVKVVTVRIEHAIAVGARYYREFEAKNHFHGDVFILATTIRL